MCKLPECAPCQSLEAHLAINTVTTRTNVKKNITRDKNASNDDIEPQTNWMAGYSVEDLIQLQDADPILKIVRGWFRARERCSKEQLAYEGSEVRCFWAQWLQLREINGLIYRLNLAPKSVVPRAQLAVPAVMRAKIFQHLHEHKLAGHFGVTRTSNALQEGYYWPNHRQDIKLWCRRCHKCALTKAANCQNVRLVSH